MTTLIFLDALHLPLSIRLLFRLFTLNIVLTIKKNQRSFWKIKTSTAKQTKKSTKNLHPTVPLRIWREDYYVWLLQFIILSLVLTRVIISDLSTYSSPTILTLIPALNGFRLWFRIWPDIWIWIRGEDQIHRDINLYNCFEFGFDNLFVKNLKMNFWPYCSFKKCRWFTKCTK
jgi:hypothetical protein